MLCYLLLVSFKAVNRRVGTAKKQWRMVLLRSRNRAMDAPFPTRFCRSETRRCLSATSLARGQLEELGTRGEKGSATRQRFLLSTIAHYSSLSEKQEREDLLRNAPAAAYIFPHLRRGQVSLDSCGRRQDASARFTHGTYASAQLQAGCEVAIRQCQQPFFGATFIVVYVAAWACQ